MTAFMLIVIALAYALLWALVLKCRCIINKTGESGYTSRDVINTLPGGAASRKASQNNKKDN